MKPHFRTLQFKNNLKTSSYLQLFLSLTFFLFQQSHSIAQSCTDNLLQNSGFESGLNNWSGDGALSSDANSGGSALEVCTGQQVLQLISAVPGDTYTFSFAAKNSAANVQSFGRLKYLSSSYQPVGDQEFAFITGTNYTSYTVESTAPANAAFVEVTVRGSNSSSACTTADDLCLTTSGGDNGGGNNGGTCGDNLIDNPGFEDNLNGWNGTGPAISTTAASGAISLKLCGGKSARQTLSYTEGEELTLLFKARTEGGSNAALASIKYFSISWQPLATEFFNYNNTTTFTEVSFSKAPPAGTAYVQIGFKNNFNNCFLIDDVCLSTGGGTGGGDCSYIKTYFPYDYPAGFVNPQPLLKTANKLSTWFYTPNSNGFTSAYQRLDTDLSGNYISLTTTNVPEGFGSYDLTVLTEGGDYVFINTDSDKPNITKVNEAGVEIWSNTFDQWVQPYTNGFLFATSLVADGNGFIAAFSNSQPGGLTPPGEVILAKVDANGNIQWLETTSGLGISYPRISIFGVTNDAIFAAVGTNDGNKVYKFNRNNGSFVWASSAFSNQTYAYQAATIASNGDAVLVWRDFSNQEAMIQRFANSTGATVGSVVTVSSLVGVNRSFPRGIMATDDNGIIYSGVFNAAFQGVNNQMDKVIKMDANFNLVWEEDLPEDTGFSPRQFDDDGGILYVGRRGVDLAILKTTSEGLRTPACDNDCVITDVEISDVTCNDSGTPTDPLDDMFSFTATVNTDNCQGTWTDGSISGTYGAPKTVSGLLIDGGVRPVSFADAANPNSSVFSIEVTPPAFCSDVPLGCGFDKLNENEILGYSFDPPFAENLPNGGFKIIGGRLSASATLPGNPLVHKELTLNSEGDETDYIEEIVTGDRWRTADGNYIAATFTNPTTIAVEKTNAIGTNVMFLANINFTNPQTVFFKDPVITQIISKPTAYFLIGNYEYQPVPNQAPVQLFFVVKIDLNGVKQYQAELRLDDSSNYPYFFNQTVVGANDEFYVLLANSSNYEVHKINANSELLWNRNVVGDLPSSDFIDMYESADGQLLVTRLDNLVGYVTKYDSNDGSIVWQFSSRTLPIPNNTTIYGFPKGTLPTPDGGAVFGMDYSIPGGGGSGFVIGRLTKNGQLIWHRTMDPEFNHRPILVTSDGGYLFAGKKNNTDFSFFKTTSTGELTPSCNTGGGNLPDLTLSNLTVGSVGAPAGEVLNYTFDLKNIGTATSGSYNIKAYISTDTQLSNDDIQDGTIPTGNLDPGVTIPSVPGASTIPVNLAPGIYYLIVKVDADDQVSESNEANNVLTSLTPFIVEEANNNGADVELMLSATPLNPGQWASSNLSLEVKNTGTLPTTGIEIAFMDQSNPAVSSLIAYQSHTAPSGTSFNSWNGIWSIPTLAPGESQTLTYKGFCRVSSAVPIFSQVTTMNSADSDSSPGNNTSGTPTEDDEALVSLNSSSNTNANTLEEDREGRVDFVVFPNPTRELLNIRFAKAYPEVEMTLVNTLGVSMLQQGVEEPKEIEQLDLSSIPNGQYFLRVTASNTRAMVRKVIVIRTY